MDVFVSIVTWNNESTIAACLESLIRQRGVRATIHVVDNASGDDTAGIVRSFRNVDLLVEQANRYFSAGHNRVISRLRGRPVLILNPDVTIPGDNVLRRMLQSLHRPPSIGALVPRHLGPGGEEPVARHPHTFNSLARRFTLLRACLAQPEHQDIPANGSAPMDVPVAQASCLLIRAGLFEQLGGFRPHTRLYFTDDELCARISDAGCRIVLDPSITVRHERSHSILQLARGRRIRAILHDVRAWAWTTLPFFKAAAIAGLTAATGSLPEMRRPSSTS